MGRRGGVGGRAANGRGRTGARFTLAEPYSKLSLHLCKPPLFECYLVCKVGIKINSAEGGRNSECKLLSRVKQWNLGSGTHRTAFKGEMAPEMCTWKAQIHVPALRLPPLQGEPNDARLAGARQDGAPVRAGGAGARGQQHGDTAYLAS